MVTYPTEHGIAIPPMDIWLPDSPYWSWPNRCNNHHNEWTSKKMGQTAVTQALRDLERHQIVMPVQIHDWLHKMYDPPELPTEEQAAREVIEAYEEGERFKLYGRLSHQYYYKDIPLEFVDGLIAQYGLRRVFQGAGRHVGVL